MNRIISMLQKYPPDSVKLPKNTDKQKNEGKMLAFFLPQAYNGAEPQTYVTFVS